MNCPHCGSPVEDNTFFCPVCGQAVKTSDNQQPAYTDFDQSQQQSFSDPNQFQQQSSSDPNGYYQQNGQNFNGTYPNSGMPAQTQPFPMKWFKFIIYFQLFLSMITCVFTAITYFTGIHYGSSVDAAMVYSYYGNGLKVMDILFGILYLGGAVLAIVVRQKLAHYKVKAPMWYLALLIYLLALTIIYLIIVSVLTGIFLLDASTIGTIISNVIMIVVNWIYFQKRASLFINE